MFFEVGTIAGGVLLGAVGEIFTKRAGFLGGALIAMLGLVVLWRSVVAAPFVPEPADHDQASKNSAFANP
jgi:predicted lipid-binding transport protein (Tim44 family)